MSASTDYRFHAGEAASNIEAADALPSSAPLVGLLFARAQVHATLAVAAATMARQ